MAEVPEREDVEIIVDGERYQAPEGYNLHLWLNEQGFEIPYFCNHEKLEPTGACRMCLVRVGNYEQENGEVEYDWQGALEASCTMTVRPGLAVDTEHPSVEQNQKEQIEFHLINHPLECPTCDKGGECQLQDWTYQYGRGAGRFKEQKREVPDSHINEFIRMNYKRCILCKRCVRFHRDIAKDDLMEFAHRGYGSVLFSFPHHSGRPQSKFSGNSVDICPVGAVTSKVFRFRGRPWEFNRTPTVDCFDAGGTNVEVHHRKGLIMRTWPRDNKQVDYGWITDKTRFAYEFVHSENRSDYPQVHNGEEWERTQTAKAIDQLSEEIESTTAEYGPDSVAIIANSILTNEELFYLRRLAEGIGTENFYFGDLIDFDPEVRDEAVKTLLTCGESVHGVSTCDTIFQFGCDVLEEAPVQGLFFERIQREQPLNKTVSANPAPADFERESLVNLRYRPGEEIGFIEKLEQALQNGGAEGELGRLVERLLESDSVGIVFGHHVLASDNPGELVLALRHLQETLQEVLESERGEDYDRVSLTPVLRHGNSMGALAVGHQGLLDGESTNQPTLGEFTEELASGKVKLLINFGRDLLEELPDRERAEEILDSVRYIASCDQFLHETHLRGNLHLATETFLEKDGSYLSSFSRLQRLVRSDISEGHTIPEFDIILRLLQELGEDVVSLSPPDSFEEFADKWDIEPDTYRALGDKGLQIDLPLDPPAGRLEDDAGNSGELTLLAKRFMFDHEPMARFSARFLDAVREPEAWISTADAAKYDIEPGSRVRVSRGDERLELFAKVMPDVPEGTVVVPELRVDQPANRLMRLGERRPAVEIETVAAPPPPEKGERVADPLGEFV